MTGLVKTARYRAKQFFSSLRPSISAAELRLVETALGENPSTLTLFQRMSRSDQKHAIAVLQTLLDRGEEHPALQQAALLHDVGKALGQPILHRVIIVLLQAFWPAALAKLADAPLTCPAWRRPFVINQQHPQIGASWAEEAGGDPLAVTLIRTHQQKPVALPTNLRERLHQLLYEADGMN
jgi:hypothetical protein